MLRVRVPSVTPLLLTNSRARSSAVAPPNIITKKERPAIQGGETNVYERCSVAMKHFNLLLLCAGFSGFTRLVNAGNSAEPFEAIIRENAFRLRLPPSESMERVSTVECPQITLQGFTTILGRAQVLLNIQPIKMAGSSWVMSEKENQDGVTIIQINVKDGTVRLNNSGLEQILALKR